MGRREVVFLHLKHLPRYGKWRKGIIYKTSQKSGFLKQRTESTSVSPTLDIYSVTVVTISWNTLCVSLSTVHKNKKSVETQSMIDSGAGGTFIDQSYAKNFKMKLLDQPIITKNIDRTINKKGTIKSHVDLEFKIGSKNFKEQFYVTKLGKQRIILGFPWLRKHNPKID